MAQGNMALFCTHAVGLGASFQHLVLILLVGVLSLYAYMAISSLKIWSQYRS